MGLISELKLAVPWGHIAAKAWGSHQAAPVLCLHGWLDNANSFDRLIPLLPKDFNYVAMDFGGHGLSSHYSPGFPYHYQNFVSEVRRVAAALKWNRFSLLGHSFGGAVGGMFSCIFPEMVDKLILLESLPFVLDTNEMDNLLTYKRRAIEHVLQVEASRKPEQVVSPEEMLQRCVAEQRSEDHLGRALPRFRQQGAVYALHQKSAGPRPARQSEAIRHLRDPQPVEHPSRGLRCHPCSTAFSLDLGPGRNCDFRGLVCRAQGFRRQGLMGGKSQPQGGTLRTLWDI
ncbi:serine hydrolase-like protein 2 isoform X4 [Bos taurus]|uniref:serine hydrolase-like protein 2 isoform X4 n=1 Tax=Bos taurus TaxID=9913 RepID=UPI000383E40C|nr:serine hydrolase-like protein 2 isoform X4 [Bos taurus]